MPATRRSGGDAVPPPPAFVRTRGGRRPRRARPLAVGLENPAGDRVAGSTGFFPMAVGDRIGGELTVLGHVAVGRGGHLYQVWDPREWTVLTCKVLPPGRRQDRSAAAALRREHRILDRCSHPHLVRVFRAGEHEDLPYLLMEYLDGPSLLDSLEARRRHFPVGDAVRATFDVGGAVRHLHEKGWLHLDVKPANVLLRGAVPVLVDLDAARRVGGPRPSRRVGTAPYMAPEQAAREVPTRATDVYGLGALLYELLTGRWPHEDELREEGADPDALPGILSGPAPPVRRFRSRVPAPLSRVVERALAPDAGAGFRRVDGLLEALAPFL